MNKCSILSRSADKKKSCLTKKQVQKITKLHNTRFCKPSQKKCKISLNQNKDKILSNLKNSLKIAKEDQISKFNFIKENHETFYAIKKLIYKKVLSYREKGWLNTYDIDDVMLQYSLKYKFNYGGAVPSNYYDYHPMSKTFPLYIVFNTHPMHKPGEHWVSMVIYPNKNIHYFDSNGEKPKGYIKKFIQKINGNVVWYNNKQLQNKDGLCGVYAMYFLINKARHRINKLNLNEQTADKIMLSAQREYFN